MYVLCIICIDINIDINTSFLGHVLWVGIRCVRLD